MSISNPRVSTSMPADFFLKLDARAADNKMYVKSRKPENGEVITAEVDSVYFAVIDEDFSYISGQVPGGGYLRSNIVHWDGDQELLVEEEDDGRAVRSIAKGKWKDIDDVVKRNGGRLTKMILALLVKVEGPPSDGLTEIQEQISGLKSIIKIDIKGMWWKARGKMNARIKVKNWDGLYVGFKQPLEVYEHKYGKVYLPTMMGRSLHDKDFGHILLAATDLDKGVVNDYREYIKSNKVEKSEYSVEQFANDAGVPVPSKESDDESPMYDNIPF